MAEIHVEPRRRSLAWLWVLLGLIARFILHEQVSVTRWLGIALVASGVGFVTSGPELTKRWPHRHKRPEPVTAEVSR